MAADQFQVKSFALFLIPGSFKSKSIQWYYSQYVSRKLCWYVLLDQGEAWLPLIDYKEGFWAELQTWLKTLRFWWEHIDWATAKKKHKIEGDCWDREWDLPATKWLNKITLKRTEEALKRKSGERWRAGYYYCSATMKLTYSLYICVTQHCRSWVVLILYLILLAAQWRR